MESCELAMTSLTPSKLYHKVIMMFCKIFHTKTVKLQMDSCISPTPLLKALFVGDVLWRRIIT